MVEIDSLYQNIVILLNIECYIGLILTELDSNSAQYFAK